MNYTLIIVGSTSGSGKMSNFARRRFLENKRIRVVFYKYFEEMVREVPRGITNNTVVLPVYCEDASLKRPLKIDHVKRVEQYFSGNDNVIILHKSVIGTCLGNKYLTNYLYRSNDIPCPRVINGDNTGGKLVFVNQVTDSGKTVEVISNDLNPSKYNTEFIDTTFMYNGTEYWTAIRTMCVGQMINEVYVCLREKDMTDPYRSASVHACDSPTFPEIHSEFYRQRVRPIIGEVEKVCQKIGVLLGLGFYSHDMIIDKVGGLFVCESGFKIDSPKWKKYNSTFVNRLLHEKSWEKSVDDALNLLIDQLPTQATSRCLQSEFESWWSVASPRILTHRGSVHGTPELI